MAMRTKDNYKTFLLHGSKNKREPHNCGTEITGTCLRIGTIANDRADNRQVPGNGRILEADNWHVPHNGRKANERQGALHS
jgi:hypothetical protein